MGTWRRFFGFQSFFWKLINYKNQMLIHTCSNIHPVSSFSTSHPHHLPRFMKQYIVIHSLSMQSKKWESLTLIIKALTIHTVSYLSVRWPSRIPHFLQPCISTHAEEDHSNAMKCLFSSKDLSGRRTINTNSFCWGNERVKAIRPPIIQTHRNYFHII